MMVPSIQAFTSGYARDLAIDAACRVYTADSVASSVRATQMCREAYAAELNHRRGLWSVPELSAGRVMS